MKIILFDNSQRHWLYPFTKNKPVSALFFGMYTNLRRWELYTGLPVFALTVAYLQPAWELPSPEDDVLLADASVLPDAGLVKAILKLNSGEALLQKEKLLAGRPARFNPLQPVSKECFSKQIAYENPVKQLQYPWHIFQYNAELILSDLYISERQTGSTPALSNHITGKENIVLGDNLRMEHCLLNATAGPIVIGHDTTVLEGTVIYGPCVISHHSLVKAGTKIYGGSIGDHCTVGGEIKNSVIMHYSNKAHEGYLGDSVVGEWCNLGAGTSNSNVRNDAADIIIHIDGTPVNAGLKCGLMMGDYTRCAINTSFNTATMVGVASSVFGAGLTPKPIPDFTWGYTGRYIFEKAIDHIRNWKNLKQQVLQEHEIQVLDHLYRNGL